MAAEPIIEPILEHTAPDLRLVPDWAPAPDPPIPFGPLGAPVHWSDVFDYVVNHIPVLPSGTPIANPATMADVQNYVNSAIGEAIKGMSGFLDQNAAMTVQAASLLEAAITNAASVETFDFKTLSQRIDAVEAHNLFIDQFVVPDLNAKIEHGIAQAFAFSLAAQQNAIDWGLHNIFTPLYDELLKVQPAINAGVSQAESVAHNALHNSEIAQAVKFAAEVAPVAAAVKAVQSFVDECGQPMCDTMGPKTDLGKLLKGLKVALAAGLLTEIATAKESDVAGAITRVASHVATIISTFESSFMTGGKTLAGLVADEITHVI